MDELQQAEYKHILIDNSTCQRRFHISYEANVSPVDSVQIDCPHCGVTLFEAVKHPQVHLVREENLVKSPNGSAVCISKCNFYHGR